MTPADDRMLPDAVTSDSAPVAGRVAPRRPAFAAGLWVVASSTLLSRILGLFRDTVTARLFGVSPVTDAFWLAFKVPNLARRLFGEGALTAAFLPAFTREIARGADGRVPDAAWHLAASVFTLLAMGLSALVLSGEAVLWLLSLVITEPESRLLLGLMAVMLPYAMLICLAAQVTAILQALGHFTWPALVPVALNVCWISSIWLVDPWFEPDRVAQAYALAVCVVVAGVFQLALQWPTLVRLGFRLKTDLRDNWPVAREVFLAMLPVVFGLSIEQINTLVDGLIAWGFSAPPGGGRMPLPGHPEYPLQAGAVSALYFAERMYQFPLGVFGIALGTVLFPRLAAHAARGELHHVRDDLSRGLRLVIAIGVPAGAGLMAVALPLTRVLFEHGEFTLEDSERTAALIRAYGAGVWAFCGLPILYRGFYAVGDRLAPVRVGVSAVFFDALLNLTLIWPLAERGLAWSTAFSATVQCGALAWLLQGHVGRLDWRKLAATALQTLAATAAMVVGCLGAIQWFPFGDEPLQQLLSLVAPVGVGVVVYLVAARVVKLEEPGWLLTRSLPDDGEPVNQPTTGPAVNDGDDQRDSGESGNMRGKERR